jgi:hypothetical protein
MTVTAIMAGSVIGTGIAATIVVTEATVIVVVTK